MGVLAESWCFCKGVGKSEKMKAAIFSGKSAALARISSSGEHAGPLRTGFLIHRNLLLTSHANVPSISAAEGSVIHLQDGASSSLVPHRFFITSSILDLTIVGLDMVDGDQNAQGQQRHFLKPCAKPNLDLGSVVYFLGYADKEELMVGEGKVVIATDNLIKLSNDGISWSPGSAGFDTHGNLAFMICDPMKLATSPNTKSSSTTSSSSSSWKKDSLMQFGIPVPVICDWLNQHWEGSLDEAAKPKLPIMRLMSTGQKSDQSCPSFSLKQVFKSSDGNEDGAPSSIERERGLLSSEVQSNALREPKTMAPRPTHIQGIPTPEIYESSKLTACTLQRKENAPFQLLDINFPPRMAKINVQSQLPRKVLPTSNVITPNNPRNGLNPASNYANGSPEADMEASSTASVNAPQAELLSGSPVEACRMHNGYSSEEETMYSAETAESRNYTSPREERFRPFGRSQSCMNYSRWSGANRNPIARRSMVEQHRSVIHGGNVHSHGATSNRSNDYFSPTVSSIMKKRNSLEQLSKPRQSSAISSPRWMF